MRWHRIDAIRCRRLVLPVLSQIPKIESARPARVVVYRTPSANKVNGIGGGRPRLKASSTNGFVRYDGAISAKSGVKSTSEDVTSSTMASSGGRTKNGRRTRIAAFLSTA
eukprot:7851919-Pyramimonas_sp.AAC.1